MTADEASVRHPACVLWLGTLLGLGGCNPGAGMLVFGMGAFHPCDYDGTLLIQLSGTGRPNWGATTEWLDREENSGIRGQIAGGIVEVAFLDDEPETDMALRGEAIEIYDGERRIDLQSRYEAKGRADGACGHAFVTSYDLSDLGPGRYTLVHKRASGVSGDVSCGKEPCVWARFQDEEALVTELVLPPPEDRPQPTVEDIEEVVDVRRDRVQICYRSLDAERYPGAPPESIAFELVAVADRAFGRLTVPEEIPGGSTRLKTCLANVFGSIPLETRPLRPLSVAYRVDVEGKPGFPASVHVAREVAGSPAGGP